MKKSHSQFLLPLLAVAAFASSSCVVAPGPYGYPYVAPVGFVTYDALPVGFYGDYYSYGGHYYCGGHYVSRHCYHGGHWYHGYYEHNGHCYYGGHYGHCHHH